MPYPFGYQPDDPSWGKCLVVIRKVLSDADIAKMEAALGDKSSLFTIYLEAVKVKEFEDSRDYTGWIHAGVRALLDEAPYNIRTLVGRQHYQDTFLRFMEEGKEEGESMDPWDEELVRKLFAMSAYDLYVLVQKVQAKAVEYLSDDLLGHMQNEKPLPLQEFYSKFLPEALQDT